MPSNAKPISLVAMVPKIVVKNLFFLLLKLGNINPISFLQQDINCPVVIVYLLLIKFYIRGDSSAMFNVS